jgi:mannose-6-phosphate isomerase
VDVLHDQVRADPREPRPEPPRRAAAADRPPAAAVAHDPLGTLGPAVLAEFGPRLPFRMRLLTVDAPGPLQVHPAAREAQRGFEREEAAGVPVDSAERTYLDRFARPALVCALTEFHALCGFRTAAEILAVLDGLDLTRLRPCRNLLAAHPTRTGVRLLFSALMTMPAERIEPLLADVVAACAVRAGDSEYRTLLDLHERRPGDRGVLASLMLNRVVVAPGEALFVPAGNLHAYLGGTGVEIAGSSDNVLPCWPGREPSSVVDFSTGPVPAVRGRRDGAGELVYPVPAAEFRLSRLDLDGGLDGDERVLFRAGPQVLLVVAGEVVATDATGTRWLVGPGGSLWVPADAGVIRLSGTGTVFRATDGLAAQWRLPSGRIGGAVHPADTHS